MKSNDGVEKSAILLVSLGEERAAEILKHLEPKEVQKLGQAMVALKAVPKAKMQEIVKEYVETTEEKAALHIDSNNYVKNVLTKALGDDKASSLLSRIMQGGETSGIEGLRWVDPETVSDLIKNEHPQIIATILVHLEYEQASDILNKFPERLRNDVILRIATLEGIQPNALQELNVSMKGLLSGASSMKKTAMGGVKTVAEILNFVGGANETSIINAVTEFDADLAQKIMDEMFVFENLLDLDDRAIQTVLREVQPDQLVMALKGCSAELKEKIFKNMSQRAAETLKEDLENKGPVRLSDVEVEQKEILKTVRRLADGGQIQMNSGGGEQMV